MGDIEHFVKVDLVVLEAGLALPDSITSSGTTGAGAASVGGFGAVVHRDAVVVASAEVMSAAAVMSRGGRSGNCFSNCRSKLAVSADR